MGVKDWHTGERGKAIWVCSWGGGLERAGVGRYQALLTENVLLGLHFLLLQLFI